MKRSLCLAVVLAGCAASPSPESIIEEPAPARAAESPPPPTFEPPVCQNAKGSGEPVVYAHAALLKADAQGQRAWTNWLAVFDPQTLSVREWISLDGCKDGLIDMAVDRNGRVFLAGANAYFWFDPKTKVCTRIKGSYTDPNGDYHYLATPNNLTFAPAQLFVPGAPADSEVLVGFGRKLKDDKDIASGEAGFIRIDPETAESTVVNPWIAGSPAWQLWPSGDLVTVVDKCKDKAVTWATVIGNKGTSLCRACEPGMRAGLDCGDCLYEFDMKTGTFGKQLGLLPYEGVFGITFWGGVLVGFNYKGKIFTIDPSVSPVATKELTFTWPAGVEEISFMGAGSTTLAPLSVVR
jgi:hypothetical protein